MYRVIDNMMRVLSISREENARIFKLGGQILRYVFISTFPNEQPNAIDAKIMGDFEYFLFFIHSLNFALLLQSQVGLFVLSFSDIFF